MFDVVNAITIQGLETKPTDSFALLVLSILARVLFSSCAVLWCFAVISPTLRTQFLLKSIR